MRNHYQTVDIHTLGTLDRENGISPLTGSTSDSYGKGYQAKGLKIVIDDSKACPLLHSIKVF